MTNLNEVLEFIKNSDLQDFTKIRFAVDRKRTELRSEDRLQFNVGDTVSINHKKMDPRQSFRVIKINSKNIKVKGDSGMYTVSPSLLILK